MPNFLGSAEFLTYMKPRIIVCGLGRTGYKVYTLLKQQGAIVIGITDRAFPDLTAEIAAQRIVIGDMSCAETLIQAGIQDAHTLVLATSNDARNLATLTQARVLNPRIRIINRLFNSSLGNRLDHILPDHLSMSVASLAAPVFTFAALGNRAIGQLRLFEQTWPIHEEYIDELHPWRDRSLSALWEDRSRMLIYYLPRRLGLNREPKLDLVSAVTDGSSLQVGDRLIIATQPKVRTVRRTLQHQMLTVLTTLRYIQQHIRPTVLITIALLITILFATLTYTTTNSHVSLVDALYFSVGMITGAGGAEEVAETSPEDIKVFTAFMMLVGAAVVGLFYALLNDLVLGTRFRQVWDTARVPRRNHYIVCGLGGVGMQILNQLHANGCEVVVIERDPNSRFLNVPRALKVPVIHGDANSATTLQSAHVAGATALLAVTSDDVVNLEIALTVKGIAPRLPVIVRAQDSQFANLSQQVFDFEAVLSPVELAAPSFAAAALGGRILGNGMTADILWVALSTMITPSHPFCGKLVREVAALSDFVPLYLESQHSDSPRSEGQRSESQRSESQRSESRPHTVHGWDLLRAKLRSGDVLYLTIPAMQLEQLWNAASIAPLNSR